MPMHFPLTHHAVELVRSHLEDDQRDRIQSHGLIQRYQSKSQENPL